MDIQKVACASCGAPISVPDDLDQINCSYCGAGFGVRRGEGYIATRLAEDVKDTIEETGVLSLTDEAERLGPLATAGVVVALLIGVGVFFTGWTHRRGISNR